MSGYLYCFVNEWIRHPTTNEIVPKIGITVNLKQRLSEANSETYGIPAWKIHSAKFVENYENVEKQVHKLLEQYKQRVTSRREFFLVPLSTIKIIFDLIPGKYYNEEEVEESIETFVDESEVSEKTITVVDQLLRQNTTREMSQYLEDNMPIRHVVIDKSNPSLKKVWEGIYNLENNVIVHELTTYVTPYAFAYAHASSENPECSRKRSGWNECTTLINGDWKPINQLPKKD